MLSSGSHPKAVVNTILKGRGEGEEAYRAASMYLVQLPDAPMCMEAARHHLATHHPGAGERSVAIPAARLARRDHERARRTSSVHRLRVVRE